MAGKNAPKSPIPSLKIRSTDPDPTRGDPILKEYRPAIQSRLRYDRVGETTLDPQGDPIAKQLRIDERKKPSFRSSAQKCGTRPDTADPIAKARHQPLGKEREESAFRSRSETNSTLQGDLIAKTPIKHQEGGGSLRSDRGLRQTRPYRVTSSRRLDTKPKQRARRNSASQRKK